MGLACGQNEDMVRQICSWVRTACVEASAPHFPFFAKLTPNVTDIVTIASAAKAGGATGVTATNTVSGLMSIDAEAAFAWPNVGTEGRTTYGGVSGNLIRPIALRAVSAISRALPGFPILATGGCDSAHSAMQFIQAGASGVQVCSAVQNQDSTVIADYNSGLQSLLWRIGEKKKGGEVKLNDANYVASQRGKKTPRHQLGKEINDEEVKAVAPDGEFLPNFGPFARERAQRLAQAFEKNAAQDAGLAASDGSAVASHPTESHPSVPDSVPAMNELIGVATGQIGAWHELSQEEHVIAEIDPEMCVNCGACYTSCNDAGYQSITFDPKTHETKVVAEDCTGCTLCLSVCPINDCITMVPRDGPYLPDRAVTLGEKFDPAKWAKRGQVQESKM